MCQGAETIQLGGSSRFRLDRPIRLAEERGEEHLPRWVVSPKDSNDWRDNMSDYVSMTEPEQSPFE